MFFGRLERCAMSFRASIEETAVLASLTLFLGMIAIWAQVIAML